MTENSSICFPGNYSERSIKFTQRHSSKGLLMGIHGQECLYIVVLNASPDHYLLVRLTLDVKKGMQL
jgi:hypothetical protein